MKDEHSALTVSAKSLRLQLPRLAEAVITRGLAGQGPLGAAHVAAGRGGLSWPVWRQRPPNVGAPQRTQGVDPAPSRGGICVEEGQWSSSVFFST